MSMRKFLAGVALCASLPTGAVAQIHTDFDAPGFADFLAVDGKDVWATNRGRIERWSKDGKVVMQVPMTKPCGAMGVVGRGMWVADCAEGTINRIDTHTGKITATVATGIAAPGGELAVVSGAGSIWVASDAKGVIARVDPKTNRVIASVTVDPDTFYLAFAFGSLWAVSDSHQTIQRIDPGTNAVVKRTALGRQSSFLAAGDDALWVVEQSDGSVARVDAVTGEVSGRVKIGDSLKFSDIDTGGGKVWVRTKYDQLFVVIDPKSLAITARVGAVSGSGGLRYTPGGLWSTQHDLHQLSWWPNSAAIGNRP
jgi:DNA-binding beta-propeller fold protein YncE